MSADLVIHGGIIVNENAEVAASMAIVDGRIAAIAAQYLMPAARETIDARGLYLLPGVIDPHVHFRDPGLEYKEDWAPEPPPRPVAASPPCSTCRTPIRPPARARHSP